VIIKHTNGQANLQKLRWFLHGPGKVGKSTCASGWPKNLFLASERRLEHIPGVDYAFIDNWKNFKKTVQELSLTKYQKKYEVVTIDVVDHLWSYSVLHTCERLGIEHQSEEGFGKGWDAVDKEFKDVFYKLLSMEYGIIVISHSTMKDVTVGNITKTKRVSTLPERARRIIIPHMGVIGYINFDTIAIKKGGKTKYVDGRTITFHGDEEVEAGDGEGLLPKKIRLYKDAAKTYKAIKAYYDQKEVGHVNES